MIYTTQNVSIIIPVYAWKPEHVDMLDRCLKSVAGQSGETIVWSDGGAEELSTHFHAIQEKYRWVKFVFSGHNGKSVSRNSAVELATRELIYPVDADDELVPGAVQTLVEEWQGTPLYSDLIKVHNGGTAENYSLPHFSCELMQDKCISSVNVLHSKAQWDYVGGWNKEINLLEDWEYNARLFWHFGAKKISRPLVRYHLHPLQHTARADARHKNDALVWVKQAIQDYVRRNETMGCCGKRRTATATSTPQTSQPLTTTQSVRTINLSLETDHNTGDPDPGKVWAKYFGGRGMGPHNRRGSATRTVYKRVSYGGVYQVKEADAVSQEQFQAGYTGCEFVRMEEPAPPPAPEPVPAPAPAPKPVVERATVSRTPVKVERTPVNSAMLASYVQSMETMTVKELKEMLDSVDFGLDELNKLLEVERAGKDRLGAVKLLEKYRKDL